MDGLRGVEEWRRRVPWREQGNRMLIAARPVHGRETGYGQEKRRRGEE
jgi:hypothetical protein